MGLLDALKWGRSRVVAGPYVVIAGYGIELRPHVPVTGAQLADGTLIFGTKGDPNSVLVKPGMPPTTPLEKHAMSSSSIVTYSSAERGTTQLVLGNGMPDYSALLSSVTVADHPASWKIYANSQEIAWQPAWQLRADDDQLVLESGDQRQTFARR